MQFVRYILRISIITRCIMHKMWYNKVMYGTEVLK